MQAQQSVLPSERHIPSAPRTLSKLYRLLGGRPDPGPRRRGDRPVPVRTAINKIYWTKDEWRAVATETVRLRREYPDLSTIARIKQAQQAVLPSNRLRSERSGLRSASTYRQLSVYEAAVHRKAPAPAPSAAPPMPTSAPGRDVPLAMLAGDLARTLASRAVRVVEDFLGVLERIHSRAAAFDGLLEQAGLALSDLTRTSAFAVSAPEQRARTDGKVRILVVGCLADQAAIVQGYADELGLNGVELKFVSKDRSPGRFDVGTSHAVLLWTKFVGHKDESALVSWLGRDRVFLYSGGLGGMKDRILDIVGAVKGGTPSPRS